MLLTRGLRMKQILTALVCLLISVFTTHVQANQNTAAYELAQQSGCLSCHAIDKKIVGPAFQAVAEKYKGDSSAEAELINKVKYGGKGNWGNIAMPGHSNMPNDDIKKLVEWILRGAPKN